MSDESKGKPRVQERQRKQGIIRFEMPEDTLEPTHRARVLWDVTGTLELGAFLVGVKAVEGTVGRCTGSPRASAARVRSSDGPSATQRIAGSSATSR